MAGNAHVLSVGVDLAPALASNGEDADELVASITEEAHRRGHQNRIPRAAAEAIRVVANVLNIAWVEESLGQGARIICPRSTRCPMPGRCEGAHASRARDITDVRQEILGKSHALP
jgi:hypothetical protein